MRSSFSAVQVRRRPSGLGHSKEFHVAASLALGQPRGMGGSLERKMPGARYSHVQSSIDTGATAKKVRSVSASQALRRRDELFRRMRPSTLVRMVQERAAPESVFALGSIDEARSMSSVALARPAFGAASVAGRTVATAATVNSVAGSVVSLVSSDATVDETRDLVLLDLREPEDFERCRVPLAVNYPAPRLNRDQFSPELQRCRRDPSKLLVVYHKDDASTAAIATLLVQKGWENVHVLSGGFEEMAESYPEVLDGEAPERPDTGASRMSRISTHSRR